MAVTTAETTQSDLMTLTIDGVETSVPKGTLLIRAAEELGVAVPRFCDHPLLDPVAACRACLVEIEGQAKPQPACAVTAAEGMVVRTQVTSEVADKAQHGVLEFLLVNHPLDCPICDKGGECPLQNQAMSNGRGDARFDGYKRTFPKPINISSNVLLDRERCVLCARCTRFSNQIAGDPFIELLERGALQQVGIYENQPFESYFSGNTVQICPVGALTSASYRFRARPFDLISTPSTCEHCAAGCAQRTDHRRGRVTRRLAANDPAVNEEWNCDKGRWAFQYETAPNRLTHPMIRDEESGELVPASWPAALSAAASGLATARGRAGVLVGGRLTLEDAYAYAKFARVALGTNDVDFRARPHTAEEAEFLAARVAGTGLGVTYADLEQAPAVVLVGLEPEEEAPIVFLRLRKAVRKRHQRVMAVAPFATRGSEKLRATLIPTAPGREVEALDRLAADTSVEPPLVPADSIVLVGERLAETPGGLSAAIRLAEAKSARLAWVPRRAGDRGAVEAGAMPNLLPGGRPVADASARVDVQTVWGVEGLPAEPGRDGSAILAAAAAGELTALVVGGVDPDDLPDPAAALAALDAVPFLVSLEIRSSAVTERADVVFPVASVTAKPSGTYIDWEGRDRPFGRVFDSNLMTDGRALTVLADELGVGLGLPTPAAARAELEELGQWEGTRATDPRHAGVTATDARPDAVVLATWHHLLDQSRLQDDEPYLAGTARAAVARLSPATAAAVGVAEGDPVRVSTEHGAITAPVAVTEMVDGVVWLPTNSAGSSVRRDLSASAGSIVHVARVTDADSDADTAQRSQSEPDQGNGGEA